MQSLFGIYRICLYVSFKGSWILGSRGIESLYMCEGKLFLGLKGYRDSRGSIEYSWVQNDIHPNESVYYVQKNLLRFKRIF